jgi:CheY-like chemotaxis protein
MIEVGVNGRAPVSPEQGVLVVDDDASIQGFLAEALADEGYAVRTAADGLQALDVLASWRPRLILLDLMMPELDGWGFRSAQRARPDIADIPVIVLSATRDLEARTVAMGAARVFSKPFDLDALLAAIEQLVRAPDRSPESPAGAGHPAGR